METGSGMNGKTEAYCNCLEAIVRFDGNTFLLKFHYPNQTIYSMSHPIMMSVKITKM